MATAEERKRRKYESILQVLTSDCAELNRLTSLLRASNPGSGAAAAAIRGIEERSRANIENVEQYRDAVRELRKQS